MDLYQLGTRSDDGLTYENIDSFLFVDEQRNEVIMLSSQHVNGERRLRSLSINPLQPNTLANNPIIENSKQTIILAHYFTWAAEYLELTRDEMRHREGLTEAQTEQMGKLERDLIRILP